MFQDQLSPNRFDSTSFVKTNALESLPSSGTAVLTDFCEKSPHLTKGRSSPVVEAEVAFSHTSASEDVSGRLSSFTEGYHRWNVLCGSLVEMSETHFRTHYTKIQSFKKSVKTAVPDDRNLPGPLVSTKLVE